MLTIFWDAMGVLCTEFLTKGSTVNSDSYCATLQSLKQCIRRIKLERNMFLLHHASARPHCNAQTQDDMISLKFTLVPHPPLQPRLGTVRFLVVPKIEGDVKRLTFFIGCRNWGSCAQMDQQPTRNFVHRGNKQMDRKTEKNCIAVNGDCVEN